MSQQIFFNVPINEFKIMLIDVVNDCLQHSPQDQPSPKNEIIDRGELCKRLAITVPTAIRWERKGKIPSLRIGSNVRYNWPQVIESLSK